jgi:hypothetical protein
VEDNKDKNLMIEKTMQELEQEKSHLEDKKKELRSRERSNRFESSS